MMTSRSEYRLLLRQDNADQRLTPLGRELGMVDDHRWQLFERKQSGMKAERKRLKETRVHPSPEWEAGLAPLDEKLKQAMTLEEILRRPKVPYTLIEQLVPADPEKSFEWPLEVETDVKYEGYIARQKHQVEQAEKLDGVKMPSDIDYMAVENLSKEAREKLSRIRPETLGQASRMGGVSPADISVLLIIMESRRRSRRGGKHNATAVQA